MKSTLLTFIGIWPASRFKNFLLRQIGFDVHKDARLSPNFFFKVRELTLGPHSIIRPFNLFRSTSIHLNDFSLIGSWNWFSSAPALFIHSEYRAEFFLGSSSCVNSRNYFDCSGGIYFGNFSDLAGIRSTFITHYIDTRVNSQTCRPINIGHYDMLSSNLKITPGASVGDKSIVAMGSVLTGKSYPSGVLIAGVPGRVLQERTGGWFSRTVGSVGVEGIDDQNQ